MFCDFYYIQGEYCVRRQSILPLLSFASKGKWSFFPRLRLAKIIFFRVLTKYLAHNHTHITFSRAHVFLTLDNKITYLQVFRICFQLFSFFLLGPSPKPHQDIYSPGSKVAQTYTRYSWEVLLSYFFYETFARN